MQNLLLLFMMMASYFFIFNNQMSQMSIALLIQTILISISSSFMISTHWYSYMIILILLGGLFILLTYLISISPMNKPLNKSLTLMPLIILTGPFLYNPSPLIYSHAMAWNPLLNMNMIFQSPNNIFIMMLMLYLLISLTIAMKISMTQSTSFRSLN